MKAKLNFDSAKKFVAKLNSAKKFVAKHRVAVAVTVTAVTCLAINKRAMREYDNFLKEKDLFNEFYTPTEERPEIAGV